MGTAALLGKVPASLQRRPSRSSVADKAEALARARVYAENRAAVGQNVTEFRPEKATQQTHVSKNVLFPRGSWWRCRDLNPGHSGYEPLALTN